MGADDVLVDESAASRAWPTTAAGLDGDQDWTPIEAMVAQLLAGLGDPGLPADGEGLLLFYLPFTDLGRHESGALCWEVMLSRGGPDVSEVEVGEHPAAALGDLLAALGPAWSRARARSPERQARQTLAEDLQHRWAGWSALLRQAAVIAAAGPAWPGEPSSTGFDLEVVWSDAGAAPGWVWQAGGMEILDEAGQSVGVRTWSGGSPSQALRAALAEADTWFDPHPQPPGAPAVEP